MGNQSSTSSSSSSSSSHIDTDRIRPFSRYVGSLGLSRHELDKRCQPSGLYGGCDWEKNAVRRLIADGRIAARQKGQESPDSSSGTTEECPICFLHYSEVNTTTCCNACMCTECFLQVRPQKEKQSTCPFCNCDDFSVVMAKKKNSEVQEKSPSLRSMSQSDSDGSITTSSNGNLKSKSTANGFGSELEKDECFKRMRKRSESFASSDGGTVTPKKEQEIIQSIAMTPEERERLEDEMKAQHYHPLVLRLESEAQERRLENDRAYETSSRNQQTNNTQLSRRTRVARNIQQLANSFDPGEDTDDMALIEAALLFNRFAEAGQREAAGASNSGSNTTTTSNNNNNNNNTNREQLEGFPLLRTLLTGQLDSNQASVSSGRNLNLRSGRRNRSHFRSGLGSLAMRHRGMGDVAMGTATMMMRGISEEEQISMAIAASMQDQQTAGNENDDDENDNNDNNESDGNNETETESSTANSDSEISSHDSSHSSDNRVDLSEVSSSSSPSPSPPAGGEQLKQQCNNGDEASTITELARVVTDTKNGIAT